MRFAHLRSALMRRLDGSSSIVVSTGRISPEGQSRRPGAPRWLPPLTGGAIPDIMGSGAHSFAIVFDECVCDPIAFARTENSEFTRAVGTVGGITTAVFTTHPLFPEEFGIYLNLAFGVCFAYYKESSLMLLRNHWVKPSTSGGAMRFSNRCRPRRPRCIFISGCAPRILMTSRSIMVSTPRVRGKSPYQVNPAFQRSVEAIPIIHDPTRKYLVGGGGWAGGSRGVFLRRFPFWGVPPRRLRLSGL